MENDLRRAIEQDEFKVYYQPLVQLGANFQQRLRLTGNPAILASTATEAPRIAGMEALLRWENPDRGLVLPGEFIPVAEETGLIVPIGQRVLDEACHQAREWRERHPNVAPLIMSVNLSARQFQHPGLVRDVARILRETGLEASNLRLEITESVVMKDVAFTVDILRELKSLGVELEIDDFGTGYSSLSYLKRFPADSLKIDRSFVDRIGEDPEETVLVTGIISLAHALGIKVTAEGVETAEQLARLREMGCNFAQGDYFAEPLTAEAAGTLLAANRTQE